MTNKKRSDPFAMIILLVFGVVAGVIALAVLYVFPVSILTCRYVETEQVDCQLQERMLGLMPIQEISVTNLKDAYVTSEARERRRNDRDIVSNTVYNLTLNSISGPFNLQSSDEFGGFVAEHTADKINDFLLTYSDEPLRIWQATWVPLLVGSFFLLVALLMLYVVIDSLARLGYGTIVSRRTRLST